MLKWPNELQATSSPAQPDIFIINRPNGPIVASYNAVTVNNGLLICPARVGEWGLRSSFGSPLSGGTGLESLSLKVVKVMAFEVVPSQISGDITFSFGFVLSCLPQDNLATKEG